MPANVRTDVYGHDLGSPYADHMSNGDHGAMRILIVEDEPSLADVVVRGMRQEGFAVDLAETGDAALERIGVNQYDVVLLDRNLPGTHGDEVCRRIHEMGVESKILMVTAAAEVRDRVDGLDLGADDYLTKPFALSELAARVRALGRRKGSPTPPILRWADLEVDPARRTARRSDLDISLTRKEFGVLEVLMAAGGRVVSTEELLERVWDENADAFTNAVRITVMTLRRKLGEPTVIATVIGTGYRLVV